MVDDPGPSLRGKVQIEMDVFRLYHSRPLDGLDLKWEDGCVSYAKIHVVI